MLSYFAKQFKNISCDHDPQPCIMYVQK
jgi:hypothetical protein